MIIKVKIMRAFFLAVGLVGCASAPQQQYAPANITIPSTQAAITFYSEPAGATISVDGKVRGTAPLTLTWELPNDTSVGRPMEAIWPSGARQSFIPALKGGKPQYYIFRRPDHPNQQADLENAARFGASATQTQPTVPPTGTQWVEALGVAMGVAAGAMQIQNQNMNRQLILQDLNSSNNQSGTRKSSEPAAYNCQQNVLGNQYNCTPRPW